VKIIRPAPIIATSLVASSVPDTPAAYSATATYALGQRVQNPTTHREFESLQANNTGHQLYDAAWWLEVGPTNRWAMFDQTNGTQTVAGEELQVDLMIAGRVNAIALLNVEAGAVQITGRINGQIVYDRTYPMTATAGIDTWFDYFFEPIERRPDLIVTDLPTYSNMAVRVRVTRPGGMVKVGTLVIGQVKDLGISLAGLSASILDYSRKGADDFGNAILVERAFAKKMSARVVVDNVDLDGVFSALAQLRATPVVWVADGRFAVAGVFGFYRDFTVTLEYPEQSVCSLEIEGLSE